MKLYFIINQCVDFDTGQGLFKAVHSLSAHAACTAGVFR